MFTCPNCLSDIVTFYYLDTVTSRCTPEVLIKYHCTCLNCHREWNERQIFIRSFQRVEEDL